MLTFTLLQMKNRESLPVLDVFPNNEEIRLDESLDDLTVSLLPSRQLS